MSEGRKQSYEQGSGNKEKPLNKKPRREFKLRVLQPVHGRRTNDEIHASIALSPVMCALIDTPQFQRLRRVRQLGLAENVYCNTNHSRFEHSLGVSHLARKMCENILKRQPKLPRTSKDILCVELAGLLHDVGHGPFSHWFEMFLKAQPAYLEKHPELNKLYKEYAGLSVDIKHEEISLRMIDAILEHIGLAIDVHNLDEPLKQIGDGIDARSMRVFDSSMPDDATILTSRDFVFIKECIYGGAVPAHSGSSKLTGRKEPEKVWMYDIVSNEHYSGLDVDKMDYFARDRRRALGTSGEVDIQMIEDCLVARVECTQPPGKCSRCMSAPVGERSQRTHLTICYGEKIVPSAFRFFNQRLELHESIYRHKTVQATNYMVLDILALADPYFRVSTRDEFAPTRRQKWTVDFDELPMSLAVLDTGAFEKLDDSVIDQIARTSDSKLEDARRLIRRLRCRDLYRCQGSYDIDMADKMDVGLWQHATTKLQILEAFMTKKFSGLQSEDFIIEGYEVDYGAKEENPLDKMRFVKKDHMQYLRNAPNDLPKAVEYNTKKLKAHLPQTFQPKSIRVYSRYRFKDDLVRDAFDDLIQHRDKFAAEDSSNQRFHGKNPSKETVGKGARVLSQDSEEGFADRNGQSHDSDRDEDVSINQGEVSLAPMVSPDLGKTVDREDARAAEPSAARKNLFQKHNPKNMSKR